MAMRTPSARTPTNSFWAASLLLAKQLSVISTTRFAGGRPVAASASAMLGTSLASSSWRYDRLTLMTKSGFQARHRAAVSMAQRSTQAPNGTMRPLSSNSGMNSSGGTSPQASQLQRASASAPITRPSAALTCGWNTSRKPSKSCSMLSRRRSTSSSVRERSARMLGENGTRRFLPCALAYSNA